MPPSAVKSVKDLIYWQYAKIIAGSSSIGKTNYGFIMELFKKLQGKKVLWNDIREYVKEKEVQNECIYCGTKGEHTTLEHLFPRSLGGPDTEKNLVWVCSKCNSSKGKQRLYEYFTNKKGIEFAKYDVPRIAEGKYLKFLYDLFEEKNMLDLTISNIQTNICPQCDLKPICKKENSEGKLSPLCLDSIATLCLKQKS